MKIQISNQMKKELETAAQRIFSGELAKLTLSSNSGIELSATDNGGEKIELAGGTVYVRCDEILGNTPLSEREMIGK
ncbi:MAG: hypothetical protein PHE24_00445 [Patescibacteria group bacterium]|nr:hypothetical protein [Patescibacteria group bacterium]